MNLNVTSVTLILAGTILLYSATKNMYPQDVIRKAMGKPPIKGPIVGEWVQGRKLDNNSQTLPPATGVPIVTV